MGDEPEYFDAYGQALSGLLENQALVGLLTELSRSGVLHLLRDEQPVEAFARSSAMPTGLAGPLLEALHLHGVLNKQGDAWGLSPAWRALTADTAFTDLTDQLEAGELVASALRGVGSGDYWTMAS